MFKNSVKQLGKTFLKTSNINQNILKTEYAVRGAVVIKALELEKQLKKPNHGLPFSDVVYCNIGNPQQLGQKPIEFNRNVISLVLSPSFMKNKSLRESLPKDIIKRAEKILSNIDGNSGAYTHSQGLLSIRENVANFIEKRDGVKSNPERIFLSDGASPSVQLTLKALIRDKNDSVLIPIPQYPLYSGTLDLLGGSKAPYYLNEEEGWSLSVEELTRALKDSKKKGKNVRGLVIINPGNPTGQCLKKDNMKDIVEFCYQNELVLMADEVYQENIYADKPFYSFKKILGEMGKNYVDNFELFSFHSVSKGFLGECGRRGGYFEASNGISSEVLEQLYKVASINLCPNVDGQLTVDLMVNPPKEGEESYKEYKEQRDAILESLKTRAYKLVKQLRTLKGVSCNHSEGSMYAFPKIELPEKAVEAAKSKGQAPDLFYVLDMLENTGVCVVPGSGFGQKDGTYHFRTTFLPPADKMEEVGERLARFHDKFLKKYE